MTDNKSNFAISHPSRSAFTAFSLLMRSAAAALILAACATPDTALADEPSAEIVPLLHAHAHNDYLHPRPLLDALDQGFCSVEADVFLVDGELLVAHTQWELDKNKTLKDLYLDPLSERAKQNGGRIYRDGPVFTLLLDFKKDGSAIYEILDSLLAKYPDVFSVIKDGVSTEKAVNVVISGDRPFQAIESDNERFVGIDGRLTDLDSDKPFNLMPMISDRWGDHFTWQGEGELTAKERERLRMMVQRVHTKGRVLRFWAIPDNPNSWKVMRDAGVDLINTDDLSGLSEILRK